MARVVHFDIPVDDPERAIRFYREAFGWEIHKFEGGSPIDYWMVRTGPDSEPGINGGMSRRQQPAGSGGPTTFSCTISVDDIDAYTQRIAKAGGHIIMEKMAIPKVGWFVHARDTEGNFFGLMQADPEAA